mgnify:CR=1 FL=1
MIATYLTEGLDKNALAELKAWIAASPENEDYFIQQREVWFSAVSREAASKYNKDKAFDTFKNRIGSRKQVEKAPRQEFRLSALWRYAAIIAVILAVGCFSYWQGGVNVKDTFADISVEAPLGSRTKLYLPDGTLVWLNAGSRMTYSQGFGVDNRKVELEGEGYFEVTKKAGATFIVQTHGYDIVVKGTKFDVSTYDDDPFISTTLLEGSVELNYKGSPIMMSPGESMRLNVETGKFIRTQVNASQSKAWAENRIEFDHITLKELVAKLSRQYDVNIRLESEAVGDKTFRISLRNRETIGEVMTALQKIIPIAVERKGKDIYIRE